MRVVTSTKLPGKNRTDSKKNIPSFNEVSKHSSSYLNHGLQETTARIVTIISHYYEFTNLPNFRLPSSFQELKKHNVAVVVRVCEPSYKIEELANQGIMVRDLAFEDGTFPPQNVVEEWFEILKQK